MLFNSYPYIFLFLPFALLCFFLLARMSGQTAAICSLVVLSFVFYGWWNPAYVPLLAGSIVFNYLCGQLLLNATDRHIAGLILLIGIASNILLLGYYKYAGFFADIANIVLGSQFSVGYIILPLAISFFTFQQIAYLVDAYKKEIASTGFIRYCLFITFFPQLIAGPIVHHKEMMPQFHQPGVFRFLSSNLSLGSAIFIVGLFKKVIIADSLETLVAPTFGMAAAGDAPTFYATWLAAFAFSLQVYFDFSGYSDMAVGAALMFGVHLPVNFFSPYKATSISEMWRRWHMTLTRFITDYIFTPVSHKLARYSLKHSTSRWLLLVMANVLPLTFTFVLVGLWHGAAWNFVLFGLLHGMYLSIHAVWRSVQQALRIKWAIPASLGIFLTLGAWVWSVVVFRAENVQSIPLLYQSMLTLPESFSAAGVSIVSLGMVGLLYVLVLLLPNTEQIFHKYRPKLNDSGMEKVRVASGRLVWQESLGWAFVLSALFAISVVFMTREVEFIYFQF